MEHHHVGRVDGQRGEERHEQERLHLEALGNTQPALPCLACACHPACDHGRRRNAVRGTVYSMRNRAASSECAARRHAGPDEGRPARVSVRTAGEHGGKSGRGGRRGSGVTVLMHPRFPRGRRGGRQAVRQCSGPRRTGSRRQAARRPAHAVTLLPPTSPTCAFPLPPPFPRCARGRRSRFRGRRPSRNTPSLRFCRRDGRSTMPEGRTARDESGTAPDAGSARRGKRTLCKERETHEQEHRSIAPRVSGAGGHGGRRRRRRTRRLRAGRQGGRQRHGTGGHGLGRFQRVRVARAASGDHRLRAGDRLRRRGVRARLRRHHRLPRAGRGRQEGLSGGKAAGGHVQRRGQRVRVAELHHPQGARRAPDRPGGVLPELDDHHGQLPEPGTGHEVRAEFRRDHRLVPLGGSPTTTSPP